MATTTGFKVQCPSCEANVTIKSTSLVGKKVDCPKCKYRFVVEAPSDLDEEEVAGKGKKAAKGGSTAVVRKAPAKARAKNDDDDEAPPKKKSNTILFVGIGIAVLAIGVMAAAFLGGVFDEEQSSASGGGGGGGGQQVAKGSNTPGDDTPPEKKENQPTLPPGTPGIVRDPTNLLPNDAQWVLNVDANEFLQTPAGSTMFAPDKPTAGIVQECLGFAVRDIERIVASGGGDGAWTFSVVRAKRGINHETLKAAMELGEPIGTIKRRDYYAAKDNPVFDAVGTYFATRLKDFTFKLDPPPGPRELTVCQLDSRTLAIADRHVMEKFLQADAQPEYRSRLTTTTTPSGPPSDPSGMGYPGMGMMGGPMGPFPGAVGPGVAAPGPVAPGQSVRVPNQTGPGAPMPGPIPSPGMGPGAGAPSVPGLPPGGPGIPGVPGGPDGSSGAPSPPRVFTSIPTYRTVNPALKAMLNHMDSEEKPIFNFAIRVQTTRLLDAFFGAGIDFGAGKFKPSLPPGIKGRDAVPKQPYIGIALYKFNSEKLDLRCGVDCDDVEQAQDVENLLRALLPLIAMELTDLAGIPVRHVSGNQGSDPNDPNNGYPGGYPGGPGFPPGGGEFPGGPPGIPPGAGPGGPGIPGAPGPGAPSAPGRPGFSDKGDSSTRQPYQPGLPPPPPGGGGGGAPSFPGAPGIPGPGMPGIPGPGIPGIPGPGGEGYPGYPGSGSGEPGQQKPQSTVRLYRVDKIVMVAINMEWKDDYNTKIRPVLTDYFEGVSGQGMMLAAKHPWKKLADVVKSLRDRGRFPRGALSRPSIAARMGLPFAPEQRLSWMTELLPGLGYQSLYARLQKNMGWNSPANLAVGRAWIPEFLDPGQPSSSWRAKLGSVVDRDLGATHFIGLSGIGEDAAELPDKPEYANRLGIFGYERETAVADITDGLDKTIFCIQVLPNIARPWIRGGGATVQGVTPTESFIPFRLMQPNGDFGAYAIMCDGSVRFIKSSIPDELFKAMVTYKAKDDTTGIDEHAPKVEITSRLRTPAVVPKAPVAPPSYVPKGWQSLSVQVLHASFGVAMPPGKTDVNAEHPWEKEFSGTWGNDITLRVNARHIHGLPKSDASGAVAQAEVTRFLDLYGLHQDGSIIDAPNLGPSKGKQFRAKPDKDFKGTIIYRLWVVHGSRFIMSVAGPPNMKDADAEEFFKTATAQAGSGVTPPRLPGPKNWFLGYIPSLRIVIHFPGEPQEVPGEERIYIYWPKDAAGGAMFTFGLVAAKLVPNVDLNRAQAGLEKMVRDGVFGKDPKNVKKKLINNERPGVLFDLREGDTVFSTWVVYNNDESVVILKARKDAELPAAAEKAFFDSLQFGIDKPPQKKKDNAGGPGVPPGGPGAPPGGPPVPPGLPGRPGPM